MTQEELSIHLKKEAIGVAKFTSNGNRKVGTRDLDGNLFVQQEKALFSDRKDFLWTV